MNKVVARFQNGQVWKGLTNDFLPAKADFHLFVEGSPTGSKPVVVRVAELKALFFVRDFAGDPQHRENHEFSTGKTISGRKIRVTFKDGEALHGTTQGYDRSRPGFFVIPADAQSNNERVFVVSGAAQEVSFL